MNPNQVEAVQAAVRILGNQAALSRALGVTPVTVGQWLKPERATGRGVPPKQCVRIEQLTGGAVTRRDLRPGDWRDIWPELAAEAVSTPPLDKLPDYVIVEAITANLIKDRRVIVRRAEDRKRLGLDIGSAGQGV